MAALTAPLPLPRALHRRIDAAASGLFAGEGDRAVDFSRPPHEPALVPAASVSWRIFKNPVTMFIGGVTAVLLELAEPRVRDGVWQNSSFRTDPLTRLRRTGMAAMISIYGPRSQAEAMIAGVVRMHDAVRGQTSEGEAYNANDVALLDWVQATASFGFVHAYSEYAHRLSPMAMDGAWAEAEPVARLYGATGAPRCEAGMRAMMARMDERLVPSPIIHEFLSIMKGVRVPGIPSSPAAQEMLLRASVALLPVELRGRLGLAPWGLPKWQKLVVRGLATAADHILLPSSPPVQSCRRLGLRDDYLYRR